MKTENQLPAIVDRLGTLRAAEAELSAEIEALKGELILAGVPTIDGGLFRATVSHCPGRETVDWKALALELNATPDQVSATLSITTRSATPTT